ncbi:hypothetical protein BGX26_011747 [Mortierella sp. AD094]|nr:hypothetical protein BGX26_011747 [Mortierella sp. AD094]
MTDDGRYWSRQLEGYEHDRYRQSRVDYEYSAQGGYHDYPAGGPDDDIDDDEVESTLAPGSLVGVSPAKKGLENSTDASKQSTTNTQVDLEGDQLASPKPPNRKRLILRLVSLSSSLLVLVFLIAAAPVSHSSSPFSSSYGLAFHYVVAILSILVSLAFVFNYWSRRLRRREKMKRCDMYNSSVFLGMIAFASYLAAFVWDIWGSFDHSKLYSGGPLIKPPPPGFDGKGRGGKKLASGGMGRGVGGVGGVSAPGAWPGQMPGQQQQQQQQQQGQGFPMKPKNSKALW